ncbi:MAG TPA: hypothetical protein VGJ14_14770 [Sporichthyaceae bacterium]|jgi:hypothetical protein
MSLLGLLAGCATATDTSTLPDEAIGVGALAAQCDSPAPLPNPTPAPVGQPPPTPRPDGFYDPTDPAPPGLVAAGYTVIWYLPGAPSGVLLTLRSLVSHLRTLDGFVKVVAAPGSPLMFPSEKNLVFDRLVAGTEVQQTCGQVAQDVVMRFMEIGVPTAAPTDNPAGTSAA